jgi:glycosyltransferase involved in cell wall biosynthesis
VTINLGILVRARPENGGVYQYTLSMLQALEHVRGYKITVYGDRHNPDLAALGYPICHFTESRAQQLVALIARKIGMDLSDRFISQDILLAPTYSLALLHTSRTFAYTLHDLQEFYYPENFTWWQRAWRFHVHALLLRRARRVICESQYVKSEISRFFRVTEQQTVVMAAPPLRQFSLDKNQDRLRAVRARLQLPEKFLFYPAQFWRHKNHLRLIEAFRKVTIEAPELKLVLTGNKRDGYESVVRAVSDAGLSEHVHFLGYVDMDDMRVIYRLATALVMPSLFESVSIPIYEAFRVGTPVAASGILSIPEQVGDAGLLFDPKSVTSIKEAILKLVQDPELARLLGKRGQDKMLAMTPEHYGAQLQGLLRELG